MAIIRFGSEIIDPTEPAQTWKTTDKKSNELQLIEFEIELWKGILEFIKDVRNIWNK